MAIDAALGKVAMSIFDASAKEESHIKMLKEQHEAAIREQENMIK